MKAHNRSRTTRKTVRRTPKPRRQECVTKNAAFLIIVFLAVFLLKIGFSQAEGESSLVKLLPSAGQKMWDFSNQAAYIFDPEKIEIISGEARLRTNAPANWYDEAWPYRRAVEIDNLPNGEDLANFQIEIKLDATNFDFSKAKSGGSDIRVTSHDGTPLDYWL